ncbi:MAG: hypothetical protein ABIN97_11825 [Ginsengibacter sp.]
MKLGIAFIVLSTIFYSCKSTLKKEASTKTIIPLKGTWKLLYGITIEKGDSTLTDYTKDKEFIKIINDTHFAFLSHDRNKGKDSAAAFSSGGGTYLLADSLYTEHLQYCSDRQWEGNSFEFTVTISGDTLIQKGIEKIANIGVDRINIEKYIKAKN